MGSILRYVREVDVPQLAEKHDWEFRTKHQLGVELLTWFVKTIRALGVEAKVWLAVDGADAARPFLKLTLDLGIVVVSRWRKDARLYSVMNEILRKTVRKCCRRSQRTDVRGQKDNEFN